MSSTLERIQSEAKQLTKEEKFELASFLWDDLHEISPDVKAYWQEEMKNRHQRLVSGEAKLISLDDFKAKYAYLEKDIPQ